GICPGTGRLRSAPGTGSSHCILGCGGLAGCAVLRRQDIVEVDRPCHHAARHGGGGCAGVSMSQLSCFAPAASLNPQAAVMNAVPPGAACSAAAATDQVNGSAGWVM